MAAKPIDKSKMSWHTCLLFMATEITLCLTPGPAVLFVVSQALQYGTRRSLYANLGILYNATTNGNNNFYVGASAYHLNHPKASFLGVDTINVPTRLTIHAGGFFPIPGSASTIYVSGLASDQAGAREYVIGGAWAIAATTDETAPVNFYVGTWARLTNNTTDAIIPYVGLDYNSFSLGLTYDVNVSSLKSASQSRGGIEISLIYIKKPSNGKHGIPCPRF